MDHKTSPLAQLKDPSPLKTDALIDGIWIPGNSRFAVRDPATGAHLADVANLSASEAQAAIAAANAARLTWRRARPPKSAAPSCGSGMTC